MIITIDVRTKGTSPVITRKRYTKATREIHKLWKYIEPGVNHFNVKDDNERHIIAEITIER